MSTKKKVSLFLAVVLMFQCMIVPNVFAAPAIDWSGLQAAINAAEPDGVVEFTGTITGGPITVNKSITIKGVDTAVLTGDIVTTKEALGGGLTLENFTVANGSIIVPTNATLLSLTAKNMVFDTNKRVLASDNTPTGDIKNTIGELNFTGCTFTQTGSAALFRFIGVPTTESSKFDFQNCIFAGNPTENINELVNISSPTGQVVHGINFNGCTFSDGYVLLVDAKDAMIDDCQFNDATARFDSSDATIQNSTFNQPYKKLYPASLMFQEKDNSDGTKPTVTIKGNTFTVVEGLVETDIGKFLNVPISAIHRSIKDPNPPDQLAINIIMDGNDFTNLQGNVMAFTDEGVLPDNSSGTGTVLTLKGNQLPDWFTGAIASLFNDIIDTPPTLEVDDVVVTPGTLASDKDIIAFALLSVSDDFTPEEYISLVLEGHEGISFDTPGEYNLVLLAYDAAENVTRKPFMLIIKEAEPKTITLIKTDVNGNKLPGAEFKVEDVSNPDGSVTLSGPFISGSDGLVNIVTTASALRITETKAPAGYIASGSAISVNVSETTSPITVINTRITSSGGNGRDRGSDDPLNPQSKPEDPTIEPEKLPLGDDQEPLDTEPKGYVHGYEDSTFRANNPVTRAEVATMLYRLTKDSAKQSFSATGSRFADVRITDWFVQEVEFMAGKQIVRGYTDGYFKPNNGITRAEFVAMMMRAKAIDSNTPSGFPDVPTNHFASYYIKSAADYNYITGYPDGTFKPDNLITRAEAVTIINKAFNVTETTANIYTDLTPSHWAYAAILIATMK